MTNDYKHDRHEDFPSCGCGCRNQHDKCRDNHNDDRHHERHDHHDDDRHHKCHDHHDNDRHHFNDRLFW